MKPAVSAFDPLLPLEISRPGLRPTWPQFLLSRPPPVDKRPHVFGEPLRFQQPPFVKHEERQQWRVRGPRMRRTTLLGAHFLKLHQDLVKRGASPSVDPFHRGRTRWDALAARRASAPVAFVAIAFNEPSGRLSAVQRGEYCDIINVDAQTAAALDEGKLLMGTMIQRLCRNDRRCDERADHKGNPHSHMVGDQVSAFHPKQTFCP
jgi:hypothetical protein